MCILNTEYLHYIVEYGQRPLNKESFRPRELAVDSLLGFDALTVLPLLGVLLHKEPLVGLDGAVGGEEGEEQELGIEGQLAGHPGSRDGGVHLLTGTETNCSRLNQSFLLSPGWHCSRSVSLR